MRYYKLDKNKQVVPTNDVMEWAKAFEEDRRVALTEIAPDITISTVFLGLDHRLFGDGPPIVFETMVQTDYGWDDQRRYCTWVEAERGHAEMVEEIENRIKETASNSDSK